MKAIDNYLEDYTKLYSRLTAFVLFAVSIHYYFIIEHYILGIMGFIFSPIIFSIPYISQYLNSKIIGSNILLLCTFIYVTMAIIFTGGIHSWILTWYIMGPILGGLLAGIRALYIWGFLIICSIFALDYFDPLIQQLPYQINDPEILRGFKMRSLLVPLLLSIIASSYYISLVQKWGKEVVEKNKSIRNLLRLVSHDISNPLTIVLSTSHLSLLKMKDTTTKEYKKWKNIDKAAKTIRKILDQVRQMQAIESGKFEFQLEPVNLKRTFEKSQFIFQEKLEQKNIDLIFESPDDSLEVMADEISFSNQVLNNIISNAIKFSFDNSKIIVNVKPEDEVIKVIIKDQGIGIPKDILKKLFDDNAKTSRKGVNGEIGTGFGMPLVRFFINTYGGQISVKSTEKTDKNSESGTEFTLTLKKANKGPSLDKSTSPHP